MNKTDTRLLRSIVAAGLIVAVAVALAWADVQGPWLRAFLVFLGVVLMVSGNSLPKRLQPLSSMRCETSREQLMRRLTGWFFVLAGLAWTITWVVLSESTAKTITTVIMAAGAVVITTYVGWCMAARRRATPPREG